MSDALPPLPSRWSETQRALDRVRPAMEADAGGVELVEVSGDVVRVQLKGSCLVCPSASLTLRHGIEATLKAELPWLERVERVG